MFGPGAHFAGKASGHQKFALVDDVAGHVYNPDLPIAPFLEALQNFKGVFDRYARYRQDIVDAVPSLNSNWKFGHAPL